jgi:hypothetical protein
MKTFLRHRFYRAMLSVLEFVKRVLARASKRVETFRDFADLRSGIKRETWQEKEVREAAEFRAAMDKEEADRVAWLKEHNIPDIPSKRHRGRRREPLYDPHAPNTQIINCRKGWAPGLIQR